MTICHDQDYSDIWVVIATTCHHYQFYFQQYFLALGTVLLKSFTGAFSSNNCLDVREVKAQSVRAFLRDILGWSFYGQKWVKKWKPWCLAVKLSVKREELRSAFDMQFHRIVVSIFLKTCVEDHGDSSSRLQERRIWLVCIERLLLKVL